MRRHHIITAFILVLSVLLAPSCENMTEDIELNLYKRVTGVALDQSSITLKEGFSHTLTATVSPSDATNQDISWQSSDGKVASVDSYGKVSAVKAGTATITVTTADGGKTATCKVTVNASIVSVTSVSLNKSSLTLTEGDTETLTATISPSYATNKNVSWKSSNTSVATVDISGWVTAVKAGTAIVTVTTEDGGYTATCEVTVKAAAVDPSKATDLSSSGTANCYIVSAAGDYKFKSVKGNTTTSVGSVSSASVVWETYGTSTAPNVGDLVNTVSYSNGYITFRATGKEGNALIAAKDASGNILWSWHIWCTDKPKDQVYKNGAGTMMDRNLGATSATPGDVGALGLLYQWGRKDPFLGSSSISSNAQAKSTISWPSPVASNSSNGTIAYATSHPTTFITRNENNYDWYYTGSSSTDNTRWTSNKSTYDPCPPGYRVPDGGSSGIWSKALGSSSDLSNGPWNLTNIGMDFKTYFTSSTQCWYPASGYLIYLDGSLSGVGTSGYFWSCTPDSGGAYDLYFFGNRDVLPSRSLRPAYGLSVRCIKEGSMSSDINVSSVSLNKSSLTLTEGDTETLTATVSPSNATNRNVSWKSSNTSVATVSSTGKVSAVKAGTATITVTTEDGGKTATCEVTVKAATVSVSGVSLNKSSLYLTEGDSETLTATVSPSDATNKNVSWKSSNTSVATVSSSGKVTAVKAGSATITVTTEDGGKTATCEVTVKEAAVDPSKATDLSSSGTANCYIVSASGDYKLKTVKGNTSTSVGSVSSASVVWETYGTSAAPNVGDLVNAVSYSNGYITFRATGKEGNALIAAKDASGNILWSWHIWCTDKPSDQVYKNGAGTLMDRNLGATSATPGDVGALGLLYQWGRKDPFLGSSSISSDVKAKSTITWPSPVASNSSNGTIAYATSHPTTFITSNGSNHDWYYTGSSSTDDSRWSSSKGTYDPCPPGYRVPDGGSNGVWSKALGSSSWFENVPWNSTNKGMDFKSYFTSSTQCWYPASGYLRSESDCGSLGNVGGGGDYWSCTSDNNCAYGLCFSLNGSVHPSMAYYLAYGLSVRCIKEGSMSSDINVSSVSLNKTSLTLTEGDTETLTATVSPSNATNKNVSWKSSNTSVATVSSSGKVSSVKSGSATITVTTEDGGKTATCSVTVNAATVSVSGVSLNKTSLTLTEGNTETLTSTVSPSNATNKNVSWKSNNTSVATVDASGKVTAVKAGSATITVTTADGGKTATCSVIVKAKESNATDLSASGTANCYIVSASGDYKFKTVKGNTSTSVGSVSSASVVWETFGTSTKPSVGDLVNTVSYSGGYIMFKATGKEGNALIAAKDASGNILWSWHIWCTDKPENQVYKNGAGTLMDRNLGATSATPGDVGTLGLLYQWGRKDPFLGSSSISSNTQAKSTITWPSPVSTNSSNGTIEYATSHPTTFIFNNEGNYDWYFTGSSGTDDTRWSSNKGTYDPCPPGYRVPDGGDNGIWAKALGSSSFFENGPWNSTNKGMDFKSYFTSSTQCWYPASGCLNNLDGSLFLVGIYGYCWSCTPFSYYACYFYFDNDSYVYPSVFNYRALGSSVRCTRE